jgi:hypothetical protein
MKTLEKIINDTLKSPNGRWSRKSLTTLSSWIMAIMSGAFITISDYFLSKEINSYAIQVFYGFLMLSGGTTAMTVYEKLKNKKDGTVE